MLSMCGQCIDIRAPTGNLMITMLAAFEVGQWFGAYADRRRSAEMALGRQKSRSAYGPTEKRPPQVGVGTEVGNDCDNGGGHVSVVETAGKLNIGAKFTIRCRLCRAVRSPRRWDG